jgi:Fe-S cluster biogenesis protein NfuA
VSSPVSILESVRKALAEDIGPALGLEGGSIEVIDIEDGVARPSTIMAVIMGVEQELRQRVPGVEYVEVTA